MSRRSSRPAPTYGVYVIVDVRTTPPALVGWKTTRAAARQEIEWNTDADHLRIRRGKLVLFHT